MDAAAKEALMYRLSNYLNELDTLPDLIDYSEPDRFSLVTELAAIKNEVKLESRQVKTALDLFRETFEVLRQTHVQTEANLTKQREQDTKARQDAERAILLDFLELRDRLQAGHSHLSNYQPNWLAKWGGAAEYMAEVAVGQAMLLRRLDEILIRRGIQILMTLGQHFDPMTMHAVQTVQDANIEDGLVVAETRSGFLYRGQLLRPAEVTVNKIAISASLSS